MQWTRLLSAKRTREVEGGRPGSRSAKDPRSEFDKDYDRSLFSTPVRRLQDKAQVFPLDPSDFIRTRLTHSLEVSTVAGGLAASIAGWLLDLNEIDTSQASHIHKIARTCGLLHDIGNPPFGHAGEDAMQEWFSRLLLGQDPRGEKLATALGGKDSPNVQDFCRFDGNAQTMRLVLHLQMLSDRHGLDLTCGTVSALCKYTAGSAEVDETAGAARAKPGFFVSEQPALEAVRVETGTGDSRNPITHLVEAADDIVYSTVDIEDGVRKGVLDWETLASDLREIVGQDASSVDGLLQRSEAYVSAGGLQLRGSELDGALVQILRTYMIGDLVASAVEAYKQNYNQIMEGQYRGELMADCSSHRLWNACKTIGRKRIYPAKQTLRLELMGRRIICDLMSLLWEGAENAPHQKTKTFTGKAYALLSNNYRTLFEDAFHGTYDESTRTYLRLQLVADYIAGMTDTFAATLHRQLTNDV